MAEGKDEKPTNPNNQFSDSDTLDDEQINPAWSTDANDMENTNQDQYRSDRQEILTAWQKDTPIKTSDNRQVLDNLEAYVQDKLSISRSLHDR